MTTFRFAALVILGAFVSLRSTAAPPSKDAILPPDVRETFEWFSSLGYPDLAQAQWAEVWLGYWSQAFGRPPEPHAIQAFVFEVDGDKFSALDLDLTKRSRTRSNPGIAAHKRITWQPLSLETGAQRVLKALQDMNADPDSGPHPDPLPTDLDYGSRIPLRSRVAILACACHRQGLTQLAVDLCEQAKRLKKNIGRHARDTDSLRLAMELDLGHVAMWRAVEEMGGIDSERSRGNLLPREEMLGRFREVVARYPRTEHVERARETIAMLERMVAEDAAHKPVSEEAMKKLPVEEQVRELVFRLRDQNGFQHGQPGWCDVFGTMSYAQGDTAAHRLLQIGLPAVPQLMVAIEDPRFSRSVGYFRNFVFSHEILTVGDCAMQVLRRIAGRDFPTTLHGNEPKKEKMSASRSAVEAWWREVEVKGERQTLVDAIASGERDPWQLVPKVRDRWPDALPDALLSGAERAREPWIRGRFIEYLANVKDDRSTAFLLTEMRDGSTLGMRVASAESLRAKGRPEAVPAMLEELEKQPLSGKGQSNVDYFEGLASFLLSAPTVEVVQKLEEAMPRLTPSQRMEVMQRLGGFGWRFSNKKKPAEKPDMPTLRAIEDMLVRSLEDSERVPSSGGWNDYRYDSPPVGELALYVLSRRFPERYTFPIKGGRRQKDAARFTATNQWRKAHDLPEKTELPATFRPLPPEQALRIVEVRIDPALALPAEVRGDVEKLVGADFKSHHLTDAAMRFANHPWPGVGGVLVESYRDTDLTGVSLVITGQEAHSGGMGWTITSNGRVGEATVGTSISGIPDGDADIRSGKRWEDFHTSLTAALKKAAPTDLFEVRATIQRAK